MNQNTRPGTLIPFLGLVGDIPLLTDCKTEVKKVKEVWNLGKLRFKVSSMLVNECFELQHAVS